jgi:hypothetical protein
LVAFVFISLANSDIAHNQDEQKKDQQADDKARLHFNGPRPTRQWPKSYWAATAAGRSSLRVSLHRNP